MSQEILNERALQARMSQLGLDKKSSSKGTGSDPVTNGETSGTFMTDVPSLRGGKSHWARTASSPPDSSKGQLDGRGLYNSTVVESAFFPGMESADLNLPNETRPKEIVDLVFKTWDLPVSVV